MHKLFAVALGLISIVLCGGALAQQYPTKPVKLIVTYPPVEAQTFWRACSARSCPRYGDSR